MVQAGVQSAMAAPVRLGATMDALLYVDRLAAGQPFTRSDLEFLAAVANQMAARLAGHAPIRTSSPSVAAPVEPSPLPAIVGGDPAILALLATAARVAPTDVPLLITGEPGTGKEMLARHVHAQSPRHQRPFQVVSCAHQPAQLEAVLFGRDQAPGVFELADGGTVFLDDLAGIPATWHDPLVRLVDRQELQRPGTTGMRRLDVRLIAAAADDAVVPAALRSLFGDPLRMPPLRERAGDIALLADAFLQHPTAPHQLAPEARALLLRHPWPGNVRELHQALHHAAARTTQRLITPADLPEIIRHAGREQRDAPVQSLAAVEKAHILRVLEHCAGNKKAAAELLEIDRSTLYAKLKQYGVG
jgi:DNA-binding NtrC family response regulator